ncbi:glycosyltransferase [Dictyobacter aurantiacus]|uniref:Glycosyl transferase family 1 n=1 Tax=Dictyobacter aurantiacus TaxID=1936993 RepID=A0A401ZK30_9CHLR|nr:glycosyltransferase [Dictyobacter aurantiacus]GCE07174.1 glycosyl transferase family 1 [Dictyobacter aurantiacus]
MHITIIAIGSRGDVQPYMALSQELLRAGHQVRLATHTAFEKLIDSYGLNFYPIDDEARELFEGDEGTRLLNAQSNAFLFAYRLRQYLTPRMDLYMQRSLEACQDADVIFSSYMSFLIAYSVAEKLQRRIVATFLQPSLLPTREFAEPTSPWLPRWPEHIRKTFNEQSHLAAGRFFWYLFSPAVNSGRQRLYQLPPLPKESLYATLPEHVDLILLGYSPLLLPRPQDWSEKIQVTGFWTLEAAPGWQPDAELVEFLQAGPPPVYIGFGSMSSQRPARTLELSIKALQRAEQRGIILANRETLGEQRLTPDIYVTNGAPHDWLFPRMSLVVHHGGAGTSAASLRAGVPSLTVYHISDQRFWGNLVASAGAGLPPMSRRWLTARRLAHAIQSTQADPDLRQRARALGNQLRQERGNDQAIRALQQHLMPPLIHEQRR